MPFFTTLPILLRDHTVAGFARAGLATMLVAIGGGAVLEAQCLTTFAAGFNYGNSVDCNASDCHWAAAIDKRGTLTDLLALDDGKVSVGVGSEAAGSGGQGDTPLSADRGFLFSSPGAKVTPHVTLLHTLDLTVSDEARPGPQRGWLRRGTHNLAGLTIGEVGELSVETKPASIFTVMRFAIRVNGSWYASKRFFKQSDTTVFEKQVINPAISDWLSEVFIAGTSLDGDLSDNPSTPLNASDVISGYGWYADTYALAGKNACVRIDNYQIKLGVRSDPYLQWAMGPFANPFADKDPDADPDHDGLSNLLEFVTGGDPTTSNAPSGRPVVTAHGDDLIVTFRRSEASKLQPVTVIVQVGSGPSGWDPASNIIIGPTAGQGPHGASYSVNETGTLDTVVVTIPGVAARKLTARVIATR